MELNPKTYEPTIELTEFVKRYWTLDGEKENIPLKNTIVPDGTMKLIFHYGDTYKHHSKNGQITILHQRADVENWSFTSPPLSGLSAG